MRKTIVLAVMTVFFAVPAFAEQASKEPAEDPLAGVHRSLKDEAFVVETDDDSGAESLNRIAGDIDLGFTTPDQEYDSADHRRSGPFSYEGR